MKNKILITLVLLIPSLCFGESGSIFILQEKKDKTLSISIETTTFERKAYILKTHADFVFDKDNTKEILNLLEDLFSIFPNKAKVIEGLWDDSVGGRFNWIGLHVFFQRLLIKLNYEITFVEKDFSLPKGEIFFYKQDK